MLTEILSQFGSLTLAVPDHPLGEAELASAEANAWLAVPRVKSRVSYVQT